MLRHNQRLLVFGVGTPLLFPDNAVVEVASSGALGLTNRDDVVTMVSASGTELVVLPYGLVVLSNPASSLNVSLTRYPDGTPF